MRIEDILQNINPIKIEGSQDVDVKTIAFDSREVNSGALFVAVKGTATDGHKYIQRAIELGAAAIVCEELPVGELTDCTFIQCENSAKALGQISSNFYGNPSDNIKLIGVTGTNGKTSIATLLYELTQKLGYKAGLLSTICNKIGDDEIPATHTTPDPIQLNALLRKMVDAGCDYCFMEVSSHAIDQYRIEGLSFDGGLFTNLTHDHLDYHKTFDGYLKAKKRFFDSLPKTSFAITNIDDKNGRVMLQNCNAKLKEYALKSIADYQCRVIEKHLDGMLLSINNTELWVNFVGGFNAYNLLAIYGCACELGFNKDEILTAMSELFPVAGRFEIVKSKDGKFAIVDYAHTPDALQNVLQTIAEIRTRNEQVISVVGCGGDRDTSKRPKMAQIAANMSDKVVLTSDNPRTEDPNQILEDMKAGLDPVLLAKSLTLVDRREAIKTAVMLAQPGDIILIAGKGHEPYQDIQGVKHHFDDKEEIETIFKQ